MPAVALKVVLTQEVVHMLLAGLSLGYPAAHAAIAVTDCWGGRCHSHATHSIHQNDACDFRQAGGSIKTAELGLCRAIQRAVRGEICGDRVGQRRRL